jgi:hypothetical protein
MFAKTCTWIVGWLISTSLLVAAGPYDWPGCVDLNELRNTSWAHPATWDQTTRGALRGWQGIWSPEYATPLIAFGPPVALVSPQADDAVRQSESHAFLLQMAALFGEPAVDLELVSARWLLGKYKTLFQEKRDGKPVLGSRADITLNGRGEIMRWGMRTYATWPELSQAAISMEQASRRLQSQIGHPDWPADEDGCFAAFFPDRVQRGLRPVWWVRLAGEVPDARWEGIVDATTGEVVVDWPGIQNDEVSGTIQGPFWYPYNSSPDDTGAYTRETIFINDNEVTSDMEGHFSREISGDASLEAWLRGPYVDVTDEDVADAHLDLDLSPPFTPFVWTWDTEAASRVAMNGFYHARFIHAWYKGLDPGFVSLDYSMPVVVNYGSNYENAFWNGIGCYFGSGGATYDNFAMYCDVIYHEYTHGVTGRIYDEGGVPLPYTGQSGALNEAWSDYFPCTITDEPLIGEGGLFRNSPQRYMRNLYNDMHFPEDWHGEVHADSPFISGALWRIRLALGASIADSLAHYARYGYATTFFDYLVEVLEADDDDGDLTNGTPHCETIYDCFGHHGIGPGLDPNFTLLNVLWYENGDGGSIGDGDGWPEAGEQVELTFQVMNDVLLFPPPAENVSLDVTSDDVDLTVANGQQELGDLAAGQTVDIEPILIAIAPDAADHWTKVTVTLLAENSSAVFQHDVVFSVGAPEVLLVKDDQTSDVESFVVKAMHEADIIFDQIELAEHENLADSLLREPGVVLWLSGNKREGILTTSDQYLLTDYLERGNRVVLSGQDIIDELSGGPFAQSVLEMEVSVDSFRMGSVRPTPESPLVPENWYMLVGSAGAANQCRPSVLSPLGDNATICAYGMDGDYGTAGLDFYDGQGIVFGFGIEAISGMSTSQSLAVFLSELFYRWASDIVPVTPLGSRAPVPTVAILGPAFPNPFNATVRLPYQVPAGHEAELIVFDILGREVDRVDLLGRRGTVTWTATGATGLYFAQLRWANGTTPVVKLVFLK